MPPGQSTIGKYEIVAELGSGAMGVVYKARENINRYVALKTLGGNTVSAESEEIRARFKTEAVAAAKLRHHNIVGIYEYSEHEGHPFIAMEYVEGCALSDAMEHGDRFESEEVCRIILSVLDGLHYAHEQGVVHRDIKPANIMIDQAGVIKIADFGIARIENSTQTVVGTVMGTAGYMPPEQIRGEQVDRRADIFSVGIMLFELLTGRRAFKGNNFHEVSMKVVMEELPQVSSLNPGISTEIDGIVARAVAKEADHRYQTAAEFGNALMAVGQLTCADADETIFQVRTEVSEPARPVEATASPSAARTVVDPARQVAPPSGSPGLTSPMSGFVAGLLGKKKYALAATALLVVAAGSYYLLPGLTGSIREIAMVDADSPASGADSEAGKVGPTALRDDNARVDVSESEVKPQYKVNEQFSDCDDCPEMRVIPAGSFMQGALAGEAGRDPAAEVQRKITIDSPLVVGVTEVTRGQFARFVADGGYEASGCAVYDGEWKIQKGNDWRSPGFEQDDSHPVTCVSWQDAKAYVRWLSGKTGKKYRLLTESEWEYVARAGTTSARSWGDLPDAACTSANVADEAAQEKYRDWKIHACNDRFIHTAPSAKFQANAYGVNDMLGNVFEWVEDCWKEDYTETEENVVASTAGDCNSRVLRGGSWFTRPEYVRSAARNHFPPDHRSSAFGFRVALEPDSG